MKILYYTDGYIDLGDFDAIGPIFDAADRAIGEAWLPLTYEQIVVNEAVIREVESHPDEYKGLSVAEIPDNTTDWKVEIEEDWDDPTLQIGWVSSCDIIYVVDGKIHRLC